MTKKRRQEIRQKSRAKTRQQMIIIGVLLLVGVIAVVGATTYLGRQVSLPEGITEAYTGLEQGFTAEGYPQLGLATAPIVVEDFSSFACPHCETLHENQIKSLLDSVEAGHVRIVFKPVISIGGDYAEDGARAAMCAGEQGKFWEMNDIVFHWRSRYSINDFRLEKAAEEIDIDANELKSCYGSDSSEDLLRRSLGEFNSRNLSGTPTVYVDGQLLNNPGEVVSVVQNKIEQLGLGG
jgi:protein-disulfide isomerase